MKILKATSSTHSVNKTNKTANIKWMDRPIDTFRRIICLHPNKHVRAIGMYISSYANEIIMIPSIEKEIKISRDEIMTALEVLCEEFFVIYLYDKQAVLFSPAAFIDGVSEMAHVVKMNPQEFISSFIKNKKINSMF